MTSPQYGPRRVTSQQHVGRRAGGHVGRGGVGGGGGGCGQLRARDPSAEELNRRPPPPAAAAVATTKKKAEEEEEDVEGCRREERTNGERRRGAARSAMNRQKTGPTRRPSKPSAHPPPGDFIALGSKVQSIDSKSVPTLHKSGSGGPLPSVSSSLVGAGLVLGGERKRDAPSSSTSGASLGKRPKLGSLSGSGGALSALGRLADAADAERRTISPSIREPSVVPIEVPPSALLDAIEAAENEGNDDRVDGLLCGAVKQLKANRARPDPTLFLTLMHLAKVKPNVFATQGVIEALCSLLRRDPTVTIKAKGNPLVSVLACNLLMAAYEEDENWPELFVKVYIEDSLGERIWVDNVHCKAFVENIQTAFGTKSPPRCLMLPAEGARPSGSDASAGASPHLAGEEEDKNQEPPDLLIAEDKTSSDEETAQTMNRYEDLGESVEEYVVEMLREQLNRRQPMDSVSRNLLRLLAATCGYCQARLLAVQKLEIWLQNPKLTRPAQELLMSVCTNCNTHSSDDVEVISNLIKIRLKPKPLLNHYMLCIKELLNAHKDNLGTLVKFLLFNELSNMRNPNNMQVLYTVMQHAPDGAPKYLAMVFQDLLVNKEDYLRASRLLLREIVKQTKHEMNFQAFCLGLMQERKETQFQDLDHKDRFVIQTTDLLTLAMMLGITGQVKEAGLAWDKGEKKHLDQLRAFQRQIAAIQRDAVWWLHTIVPAMFKLPAKDYVHCLYKVLFTEQPETYYKWDNWPPEGDRNFFLRLCSEVPLLEDTLMRILVMGLSRDLPLGPADAMELADHLVKRAAGVQAEGAPPCAHMDVLRVDRIQLLEAVLNLATYHYPENIHLPAGYTPPTLAISNLYWKAWLLLLVVMAFNPQNIGQVAWEDYPTLKMMMEMAMTNNYAFPPCTVGDEESRAELTARELQMAQVERQDILQFESHLAAASTKQTITQANSLLLPQLMTFDPRGVARRPPASVVEQLKGLNQNLKLGQLLCCSRSPDFLLSIIQRQQGSSQSMPWLAELVESSEGSLDILPVQCLCEFLLHDAAQSSGSSADDDDSGKAGSAAAEGSESKERRAKRALKRRKQKQLLSRLRELLQGPRAAEHTTTEVLDYFLRRLSSQQAAARHLAIKGLAIVLGTETERSSVGEDADVTPASGEDSRGSDAGLPAQLLLLPAFRWLLRDLPQLPLFRSVNAMTLHALMQAIHVETDPDAVSAYLLYLSQHLPLDDQQMHNSLMLDVSHLIVERTTIVNHLFFERTRSTQAESVLSALLFVFSTYMRCVVRTKEEETYSWSESQDQIFIRWASGETATMHILVVHALVILLTLGPLDGNGDFAYLLDVWFSDRQPLPTAFLVDTSEEALLLPDWLKLRMIRSEVSRLVDAALQELEVQQLILFVQSFGIPVCSMSKLLHHLDQAVTSDPYTLEHNIMDKNYMAQLVDVQHERGATGGFAFHSILAAAPLPQTDALDMKKPGTGPSSARADAVQPSSHRPLFIDADEDVTAVLLQIFPPRCEPGLGDPAARQLSLALQRSLAQEAATASAAANSSRRTGGAGPATAGGAASSGGAGGGGGVCLRVLQALQRILASQHRAAFVGAVFRLHSPACQILRYLRRFQKESGDGVASALFADVLLQLHAETGARQEGPLHSLIASYLAHIEQDGTPAQPAVAMAQLLEAAQYGRDAAVLARRGKAAVQALAASPRAAWEPRLFQDVCFRLVSTSSPYLEEFVRRAVGGVATTGIGGAGGAGGEACAAALTRLLLLEVQRSQVKRERSERPSVELSPAGLFIDWLELLNPEVMSTAPATAASAITMEPQLQLLFTSSKSERADGVGLSSFRLHLLSLLTHQSNWCTLHRTVAALLAPASTISYSAGAVLDFLWACTRIPRLWQGRDIKTPRKRSAERVLRLTSSQLLRLVDLIVEEAAEKDGEDGAAGAAPPTPAGAAEGAERRGDGAGGESPGEAGLSSIQARLPLLLGCCQGNSRLLADVAQHLIARGNQRSDGRAPGSLCSSLLLQIYLQAPEVVRCATLPDALLQHAAGTVRGRACKLDAGLHRLCTFLVDVSDSRASENRANDANLILRKMAVSHPLLLLRHLPMIAALLQGRAQLSVGLEVWRVAGQLGPFSATLGLLQLLRPLVFGREHARALADVLGTFVTLLQNLGRCVRQLTSLVNRLVQFVHGYVAHDPCSALTFLRTHAAALQQVASDYRDLTQLKSLLAGLSLPPHSSSGTDRHSLLSQQEEASSALPLVGMSATHAVMPSEMAPYQRRLTDCRDTEDILEALGDIDEMSRRKEEILKFFQAELQVLMGHADEACRDLAFTLAMRSGRHSPRCAPSFLPAYLYCLDSDNFDVVQTALRNLPEFAVLCQEHVSVVLHRAFLAGVSHQLDTSPVVADALQMLRMEILG
ncbi:integrator complex subunit 1 [Lethenteron reissneri]|uniref:integrator complex subunit 1 n=1 Tax=Lethenteron reissneri TaxID=7753 RepID=UPI002AB76092|nr:integrator complex subunit 1 [Lethenteron reissneri]